MVTPKLQKISQNSPENAVFPWKYRGNYFSESYGNLRFSHACRPGQPQSMPSCSSFALIFRPPTLASSRFTVSPTPISPGCLSQRIQLINLLWSRVFFFVCVGVVTLASTLTVVPHLTQVTVIERAA